LASLAQAHLGGFSQRRPWLAWLSTGGSSTALLGGCAVIVLLLLAGFLLPLPYHPNATNVEAISRPPSAAHWFGTDVSGRDVFSRVVASARRDLPLSLAGTLLSLVLGVPLGLVVSGKGKWGERLMRVLDAFQAFPLLVLAVAIVTLTGNQVQNVVLAIALVNTPRFMRLVRSEALVLRESRFIEAATAVGCSPERIMFRHLLPNVVGVVLVQSSLGAASAIMVIAALNFLGIAASPPDPTWGSMIQSGARNIIQGQWWMSLFPGLAVLLSVFSLNVIADSLEQIVGHA
jgi:peptide/nickel transport system permease protein